jgi:DNA-binding beta-propeller fold protein YncE
MRTSTASTLVSVAVTVLAVTQPVRAQSARAAAPARASAETIMPTGMRITPLAPRDARFENLNPDLAARPDYLADHAVEAALSPDGKTLLILTSGYNRNAGPDGAQIAVESNEYVFVYDVSTRVPVKRQVLQIPNTFSGIAWNPRGDEFYVAGGVDDNVHVFGRVDGAWSEAAAIALGHADAGVGLDVRPMAAGLAVNPAGTRLLVANFENDSVSLIDLTARVELTERDLRPGKIDPAQAGVAGGSYPLAVVFTDDNKAWVSSQRDRELIALDVGAQSLNVSVRIALQGQPNRLTANRTGTRLYAAVDNSDSVVIVDTAARAVIDEVATAAPSLLFSNVDGLKGVNPNHVALSPDERTLFVTNGGTNSVAVIQLGTERGPGGRSRVVGLIPTGWYPNAVAISRDGARLFVVNGKSNSGPNPRGCRDTLSIASGSLNACRGSNQYVWQLEKAGFSSLPVPGPGELARLSWQVAENSNFPAALGRQRWERTMAFLRRRIEHVVYVIKENRTYDQMHGDLDRGNGDPSLSILSPFSPNHQALARSFVTLDNFYDSGETSNSGWNWTTAARSTDFTEKTSPINYAGRGLTYDWEGTNRNIAVGLPLAERRELAPTLPDDPDILAGSEDVAAPDSPDGEAGAGYLWNAALRAGLTIRNYGVFVENIGDSNEISEDVLARPFAAGVKQAKALKTALLAHTDEYFRGYDQSNADFYLFKEWEREFDGYAARGDLPNLSFVRFPHDHFGNFGTAKWGVNTVETQMADNDLATALLIEKIANSPFAGNTLVFVIEDDAQNGGDHVDAHRSIAYVAGPYVKQGAVISKHYTTVSLLRTIEEVLGIEPMGINDGLSAPMAEVFDERQRRWDFEAVVPEILYTTRLELPAVAAPATARSEARSPCRQVPQRTAEYWQRAMAGQSFATEDRLDEPRFNRALWTGLKGGAAFPEIRHGIDLRRGRRALLRAHRDQQAERCRDLVVQAE